MNNILCILFVLEVSSFILKNLDTFNILNFESTIL